MPADLETKYQNKLDNFGTPVPGQDNPAYAAMIETVDTSLGRLLDAWGDDVLAAPAVAPCPACSKGICRDRPDGSKHAQVFSGCEPLIAKAAAFAAWYQCGERLGGILSPWKFGVRRDR